MTCQACDGSAKVDELVQTLEAMTALMELAFNHEGDVFGFQHNDAVDVCLSAQRLLRELREPQESGIVAVIEP